VNFEKIKAHFNCLRQLEGVYGDLSDAPKLREVLRQNSFLLGMQSHRNKSMEFELRFLKRNHQRLINDKQELQIAKKKKESELASVTAKLYDIDYDAY